MIEDTQYWEREIEYANLPEQREWIENENQKDKEYQIQMREKKKQNSVRVGQMRRSDKYSTSILKI